MFKILSFHCNVSDSGQYVYNTALIVFQITSILLSHCTLIEHMSLNKYGYHIANMSHTAIMLNGNIDPTFLHICAKTQPTKIFHLHVIATCARK